MILWEIGLSGVFTLSKRHDFSRGQQRNKKKKCNALAEMFFALNCFFFLCMYVCSNEDVFPVVDGVAAVLVVE